MYDRVPDMVWCCCVCRADVAHWFWPSPLLGFLVKGLVVRSASRVCSASSWSSALPRRFARRGVGRPFRLAGLLVDGELSGRLMCRHKEFTGLPLDTPFAGARHLFRALSLTGGPHDGRIFFPISFVLICSQKLSFMVSSCAELTPNLIGASLCVRFYMTNSFI